MLKLRTLKKKKVFFKKAREKFKDHQDKTWELAKKCVERQYPNEDVKMAHYLQDKYRQCKYYCKR